MRGLHIVFIWRKWRCPFRAFFLFARSVLHRDNFWGWGLQSVRHSWRAECKSLRWRYCFIILYWREVRLGFGCVVSGICCAKCRICTVKLVLHFHHLPLRFLDLLQLFIDLRLQRVCLPAHRVTLLFFRLHNWLRRGLDLVVVNSSNECWVSRWWLRHNAFDKAVVVLLHLHYLGLA